jgi:hypothetical protein
MVVFVTLLTYESRLSLRVQDFLFYEGRGLLSMSYILSINCNSLEADWVQNFGRTQEHNCRRSEMLMKFTWCLQAHPIVLTRLQIALLCLWGWNYRIITKAFIFEVLRFSTLLHNGWAVPCRIATSKAWRQFHIWTAVHVLPCTTNCLKVFTNYRHMY